MKILAGFLFLAAFGSCSTARSETISLLCDNVSLNGKNHYPVQVTIDTENYVVRLRDGQVVSVWRNREVQASGAVSIVEITPDTIRYGETLGDQKRIFEIDRQTGVWSMNGMRPSVCERRNAF